MRNTDTIIIGAIVAVLLIGAAAIFMCTTTDSSSNDVSATTTDVNAYYFYVEEKADAVRTVDALSEAEIASLIENLRAAKELANAADEALAQIILALTPVNHFCHAIVDGNFVKVSYGGADYVVIGDRVFRLPSDVRNEFLLKSGNGVANGIVMFEDNYSEKAFKRYQQIDDSDGVKLVSKAKKLSSALRVASVQQSPTAFVFYKGECICDCFHDHVLVEGLRI